MKKLLSIFVSLVVLGGNGVLAQSLKKQNQQLKTQNTILTDSIQKLNTSLDSVAQLKTKLTADYEKLKAQYGKSGTKADSLFKVCQLQASEIYALQVTNDSLSSRIQKLLAERSSLQYQTDSLLALQERKLEEKKQKELWDTAFLLLCLCFLALAYMAGFLITTYLLAIAVLLLFLQAVCLRKMMLTIIFLKMI